VDCAFCCAGNAMVALARAASAFTGVDGDLLLLFPITTKGPEPGRFAVEIPLIEKRRAGPGPNLRLWIISEEYNTDIVGQSFYLEPAPPARTVQQGILSAAHPRLHRPPKKPDRRQEVLTLTTFWPLGPSLSETEASPVPLELVFPAPGRGGLPCIIRHGCSPSEIPFVRCPAIAGENFAKMRAKCAGLAHVCRY
jgi:hypothetical protein